MVFVDCGKNIVLFAIYFLAVLPFESMCMEQKITIIGGGLSGLSAALELYEAGYENVTLLEARLDRFGGRILSVKLLGSVVEVGGQNIADAGPDVNCTRDLAKKLGLTLHEELRRRLPFQLYADEGLQFPDIHLKNYNFDVPLLRKRVKTSEKNAKSMEDVLDALFPDDPLLRQAFGIKLAAFEGASPDRLSATCASTLYHMILRALCAQDGTDLMARNMYIEGGNSLLINAMVDRLPKDSLHLNKVLSAVHKTARGGYVLDFEDGTRMNTDILILSMPCPVYNDIEFGTNVIPRKRLRRIRSVCSGTNGKILVPVKPSEEDTATYATDRMLVFKGCYHDVVTLFYIGNYGTFTADTLQEVYQRDLPILMGTYQPLPGMGAPIMAADKAFVTYDRPIAYSWVNDRFAQGSYSCIGVGQEEWFTALGNYKGEKVKKLFAPIDNTLYFTGEATSILMDLGAGTIEAAIEAGTRIARCVMKAHPLQ